VVNLKVVTGYVPIRNHPRPASEYAELGEKLKDALQGVPVMPYYTKLDECWLQHYLNSVKFKVVPSVSDNPAKNTEAYLVVQHQKFAWLANASMLKDDTDVLVWMDYGIMGSIPGVTKEIVTDFLNRVREKDFAIPGCWQIQGKGQPWPDEHPCWRFCGGVMVVPVRAALPLFVAVKNNVQGHLSLTKRLSWEVNTLARMERLGVIKPRWYQADHNETMFTGYK
jgi:hypothetical protein